MKTCLKKTIGRHYRLLLLLCVSLSCLAVAQGALVELRHDTLEHDALAGHLVDARELEIDSTISMPVMKATYLGLGGFILRDTYLSPLSYGGYNLHFAVETAQYRYRGQGLGGWLLGRGYVAGDKALGAERWLTHRLLSVDYSLTDNPARNASIHRLQGRWETARLYKLYQGRQDLLMLGGGYTIGAGGLYSTRNGNNPATLKLDASLSLAASYSRRFNLLGLPLLLRLSSRTDLLGVQWSQQYGENYYELYSISRAFARRFYLTHLGNQLAQQIRCSIDLPIFKHSTLSVNYRLHHRSWTLNEIRNRQTDHTISLGLVRYLRPVDRRHTPNLLPF